jgi:glyoxylase-like metal-dependent hydrolase (beta-lactamase superfamily II)
LVETGYGSKTSPRDRENYGLEAGGKLPTNLARAGVEPADVRWVVLTHLHFDHVGGCTVWEGGSLRPTFPHARHFLQRAEWEDATADLPELAGSYFRNDFEPLADAGLVELVDGQAEPVPGVSLLQTGGHTRGHQAVYLRSGSQIAAYLGDLCPTPAHLRTLWCTAYDQFPLTVRRTKSQILAEAVDNRWLVIFGHCPEIKAAYLARDKKGDVVVQEPVDLS